MPSLGALVPSESVHRDRLFLLSLSFIPLGLSGPWILSLRRCHWVGTPLCPGPPFSSCRTPTPTWARPFSPKTLPEERASPLLCQQPGRWGPPSQSPSARL